MAKRERTRRKRGTISRHNPLSDTDTGKAIERAMARLRRMEAERRAADRRSVQLTTRIGLQRAELVRLLEAPPSGPTERNHSIGGTD